MLCIVPAVPPAVPIHLVSNVPCLMMGFVTASASVTDAFCVFYQNNP